MIKLLYPLWAAIAFMQIWMLLFMIPTHGNFNSSFGDWVYGRNCNYGHCDGALAFELITVAIIIIGYAIIILKSYRHR